MIKNRQRCYQHIAASVNELPFTDDVFSLVTAFSLLEHIPEAERNMYYKEIRRVIKRKGAFVIQLPNRYAIIESHTYLPFFGFLPSNMHLFAYRNGYVAVPSLKVVIGSLKEHGFDVNKIEKYQAPFLPFGRFLSKIGLFRFFPMGYVIHSRAKS